jgi:hypothetical protein
MTAECPYFPPTAVSHFWGALHPVPGLPRPWITPSWITPSWITPVCPGLPWITRQEVNHWILNSREFDGVIDFDEAVRDPSHPAQLLPAFDSGDHLHVNDAGNVAQGNNISLDLFRND